MNDTRQISGVGVVFLGNQNGSDILYDMTIKFGKYSLRRYAKGTSLVDCIPDPSAPDRIWIDVENRKIVLKLS